MKEVSSVKMWNARKVRCEGDMGCEGVGVNKV